MTAKVAVIGAGLMGTGIAQLLIAKGHHVTLYEPIEAARRSAIERVAAICAAIGEPAECVDALAVTGTLDAALDAAEWAIEAAPEKPELKQKLFDDMVRYAPPETLLATNSSVIPVTTIAQRLSDSDAARVVGMHFWNPPHLIPLVEVIQGQRTGAETVQRALEFLRAAGKAPVHVRHDMVIGNRVQHALWREAIALVASGAIDAAGIDTVIKNSFGLRLSVLGPLENCDLVGIELVQDVHREVFPKLSRETEPNPLLQRMLDAGEHGMASGRGFYSWTPEQADAKRRQLTQHLLRMRRNGE
jgi:3-hydroxybutyryl-CoA dehydrogenase